MKRLDPAAGAADDVDPDIRTFQLRTSADYATLSGGCYADIAQRRNVAELVRRPWVEGGPEMASILNLQIGRRPFRIRIYRPVPGEQPLPTLVYLHGGGWTLFSIDTHDRLMREYAARAGCAVVGVDYSLAPEHPYPAALNDIAEALDWIGDNGSAHGLDSSRMAIGGDSAGANLAIASALRRRDPVSSDVSVRALLLNYGAFDVLSRESHRRYDGDRYMLTAEEMLDFWNDYIEGPPEEAGAEARPLLADLSELPPTFLCIAECDILADENREMARLLAQAGNDVHAEVYRGATHSFLEAVSISSLANRALDDASRWLAQRLRE
ncbi:MAG: alpha/beta hydrolase [Sphingobium sp.]